MTETVQVMKPVYSNQYSAKAAAGYLKSFGLDAAPKLLKGKWRVVVYRKGK